MKLSDYVVRFLEGITNSVFLISGGGIMHLVDSLGKSKTIHSVCCHHEQAAATAAEGYARIKNAIGVVMVTTGPGGTNAITGAAGSWLDSIPLLVINGQVKTDNIAANKSGKQKVRAIGFQELNVLDLVKPISKYAVTVKRAEDIKYQLEKAVYMAKSGRPGPAWVEIPLDIQAAEINPNKLRSFHRPDSIKSSQIPMKRVVDLLKKSRRPLLLVGNGIRLAGGEKILLKLINKLKINTVTALYTADDLVTHDYEHYLGRQGMWGNKTANWAIDNCDLLLVVGERLQLTQLSYEYKKFAPKAIKIMVDIDQAELIKKTINIQIPVNADAKYFLSELNQEKIELNRWNVPISSINPLDYKSENNFVNVYSFIKTLNKFTKHYPIVTSDAMAATVTHQFLQINNGQRFIVNAGLGQMGQGLPMSVGACIASNKSPTVCIEGDGSLMLNIHELQTIQYHKLPIKIFIFNNDGYNSIRNTHLNYFGKVFAADSRSGVSLPDYEKLIPAWGFPYLKIKNDSELIKIKKIFGTNGPYVCEIMIDPKQKMIPKWSAGEFFNKTL